MPKTRAQKQDILQGLQNQLSRQKALLFVEYSGLSVRELAELRQSLEEAEAQLQVAKKTLLDQAFQGQGLPAKASELAGQLGVVFAYGDPVEPARRAFTFGKAHASLQLLGGLLEGRLLGVEEVKQLATLPSRDALLAQFVGTVAAPLTGFLRTTRGNVEGFVRILNALQTSKAST